MSDLGRRGWFIPLEGGLPLGGEDVLEVRREIELAGVAWNTQPIKWLKMMMEIGENVCC
jgi:hypothetical protein